MQKRAILALFAGSLLAASVNAHADVALSTDPSFHFDSTHVTPLLNNNLAAGYYETPSETYVTSSSTTAVQLFDSGDYKFSFGWYKVGTDLSQSSNLHLLFSDIGEGNAQQSATFSAGAGTQVGFFLVPNGANSGLANLYTQANLNPGKYDQALSWTDNKNSVIAWEDITRTAGSDVDFNDVVVKVGVTPVPEPSEMALLGISGFGLLGMALVRRFRRPTQA